MITVTANPIIRSGLINRIESYDHIFGWNLHSPLATDLIRRLLSFMIGLWVVLVSVFPATISVLWHRSTSFSSCFWSSSRMSLSRTTWTFISRSRAKRHVNGPSYNRVCCVMSRFYKQNKRMLYIAQIFKCYTARIHVRTYSVIRINLTPNFHNPALKCSAFGSSFWNKTTL